MKTEKNTIPARPCDECPSGAASRREFLQSVGYAGLAAALFGLSPEQASALPLTMEQGTGSGGERRYPVPAGDGVNVDRSASVIVVRLSGHMYAFALSCPHENNAVKWVAKDKRFQCTKHDSQYSSEGVHTSGRATRNMDRYAIRRDGDAIAVNMHQWFQSDKDPAGWASATITL